MEIKRLKDIDCLQSMRTFVMQQETSWMMSLLGLHRGGLFDHAVFYGGIALRILYRLDRFSEDLDFSLLESNDNFNPNPEIAKQ